MRECDIKMKEKETEIPIARLLELFDYDPATGDLTRKVGGRGTNGAGSVAGTYSHGYIQVVVDGYQVKAHRMAFAMYFGRWPENQIDHINRDRSDNRISNLREVTQQENLKNRAMQANNSSGITGVYWDKRLGKWRPQIRVDGKNINLGLFDSFEEAAAARKAAEILYGFHENHGQPKNNQEHIHEL